jgi:uncharacterized protein
MKLVTWFQIPALDLDRAITFYTAILDASFHRIDTAADKHAFFKFEAMDPMRTGGEIVQSPRQQPSSDGVLVYLQAPGGVEAVLAKVTAAGGTVLSPKTSIGENGWIALIRDSEGNRIGLHSN